MTTTKAPHKAVSPESVSRPQVTVEYERMATERQRAVVPTVFRTLLKRSPTGADPEANHSRREVDVAYRPFVVPLRRPNLPIQPWPLVLPPLFPACATTILAAPYLYGSDETVETGRQTWPLSYSRGHNETGSVELFAQVVGTDKQAPLYDDLFRRRIAAGFLVAGVYTVPASSGAVEVVISAPVKAVGSSVIFEEAPDSFVSVQLLARMDVMRVGGAWTSDSNTLHTHPWGFPPVSIGMAIAGDAVLSTAIPVAEGDQLAIVLSAEARLIVQDGRSVVAALNVSSDQSYTTGGSVSFPYVSIRLC